MNINPFRITLTLFLIFSALQATSTYHYNVNLTNINRDQVEVILNCSDFATDTLIYHFPKIVPGTYEVSNFGRFVRNFEAFNKNGRKLKSKKVDNNSYIIYEASQIQTIQYSVRDTWDMFMGHIRVFPMEGTNFDEGNNFVINNFAVFGYFEGYLLSPIEIMFLKPAGFYGVSALPQTLFAEQNVQYQAENYHHLVDCPIMFSVPDTVSFNVLNTEVQIGTYHENRNISFSTKVHNAIQPSLEAVGVFLDSLPAENYVFIYYIDDSRELGKIIKTKHFKVIRIVAYMLKNGIPIGGALEHNNSTFGYSLDPGESFEKMTMKAISDISIHEFLHVLTPLSLHSQYIQDFNYSNPVMSKHLWLYEGCTEYFANLALAQGGLITPKEFLLKIMRRKLVRGEKFPNKEMSFTQMSSNVLKKGYKRQYMQVYQRGAVLAMLLDIEIIRLTNGKKSLIDVIDELTEKFDKDHPFDEDSFIDEFVGYVHPDLKSFFDKYIEGNDEIPYQEIFNHVGVNYHSNINEKRPPYPLRENAIKFRIISMSEDIEITKVKKGDVIGFQKGDRVNRNIYLNYFQDKNGGYLPQDSTIQLPVIRDKRPINIPVKINYVDKSTEYKINIMEDMTPDQKRLFNIWLGIR